MEHLDEDLEDLEGLHGREGVLGALDVVDDVEQDAEEGPLLCYCLYTVGLVVIVQHQDDRLEDPLQQLVTVEVHDRPQKNRDQLRNRVHLRVVVALFFLKRVRLSIAKYRIEYNRIEYRSR